MLLATQNRRTRHSVAASSDVEQAGGVRAQVLDRIGQVVAGRGEVHDAGDLVALADVEDAARSVVSSALDDDPVGGLAGEELGQPVRTGAR